MIKNAAQGLLAKVAEEQKQQRHAEEDKAFAAKYGTNSVKFDASGNPIPHQSSPSHVERPSAVAEGEEQQQALLPHATGGDDGDDVFVESVRNNSKNNSNAEN